MKNVKSALEKYSIKTNAEQRIAINLITTKLTK